MSATYISDFSRELNHKRRAGFGCVVVPTREQQAAESEIYKAMFDPASNHHPTKVFSWSCASGIKTMLDATTHEPLSESNPRNDIMDCLLDMPDWLPEDSPCVIIMCDVQPFMDSPMLRRLLLERIHFARFNRHFVIIMQRNATLHEDFNDEVSTVKHCLPGRVSTEEMANAFLTQVEFPPLVEKGVDNLQGLTAMGQANAIALSIIDAKERVQDNISIDLLRKHKEKEIGRREYLKVYEPGVGFDDIVGNELLKQWVARRSLAYSKDARDNGLKSPLGIMMAGPPGTGKTRLAEAIAHHLGFPFVFVDIGLVFGGLLGESEHNAEDIIQLLEAMAPCVALFDEVERAFGSKGGDTDGGTTDRVIGKFLTWLSTKTSDVFSVFTANNVDNLPAAMIRKGRLDQIFCVDLPTQSERKPIWEYFLNKKNHKVTDAGLKELVEVSNNWVGAEIEAVVEEAHFMAYADGNRSITVADILTEAELFVPVAISMEQQVNHMREWAKNNARPTAVRESKAVKSGRNLMQ